MRSTSALLTLDKHALGAREKDKMLSKMAIKSGCNARCSRPDQGIKEGGHDINVPAAAMAVGKGWGRM